MNASADLILLLLGGGLLGRLLARRIARAGPQVALYDGGSSNGPW
jgi:prephenate dehydrogenase